MGVLVGKSSNSCKTSIAIHCHFDYQRVSASAMFKKVRVLVVVKVNCPRINSTFVTSSRQFCSSAGP